VKEKGNGVLCKYDFKVNKTGRAKGALLLYTDKGCYLMKEYKGKRKHLEFEHRLLNDISFQSEVLVDNIVEDREGNIVNEDENGTKYVIRKWYDAKDMDFKNLAQIIKAAGTLGKLHNELGKIQSQDAYISEYFNLEETKKQLTNEFVRHNKELKRTRNFIRGKRQKNEFELMVLSSFDEFYSEGVEVIDTYNHNNMDEFISESITNNAIIHGSYNYHNIIITEDKMVVTNFEHSKCGIQIRDLYDYVRKVMEKHSWNSEMGYKLIKEYDKYRRISDVELKYLELKLRYPEKYWKLLNHYYNSNKAWVPDKDVQKLRLVIDQQKEKQDFILE
jgi:spore coat protein I